MTSLWSLSYNLKVLFLFSICMPRFEGRELSVVSSTHQGMGILNVNNKLTDTSIPDHQRVILVEVEEVAEEEGARGTSGDGSSAVGSRPPSCISKCGTCKPCTPVRVPVPPGTPTVSEYYPEAWRCKCGGKLYMP